MRFTEGTFWICLGGSSRCGGPRTIRWPPLHHPIPASTGTVLRSQNRKYRHIAGQNGDAHGDHDGTGANLQWAAKSPESAEFRQECAGERRRDEKGKTKPERIDAEEGNAVGDVRGGGAQSQYRTEHRADAGGPAEGKRQTQEKGTGRTASFDIQ